MTTGHPLVLILRFRDLVRPDPGYTVSEHNKISAVHGYTWWGWWKKQTEEIPVEVWSEIARQATAAGSGGLPAFLVDSGQRKLYSTRIFQVSFQPDHAPAVAPEAGKTPEYYNPPSNPTALASWFKIGNIVEVKEEDELTKLMYAVPPHDDLILATKKDFDNRKMGGIRNLLSFGNITYWVGTHITPGARPPLDRLDAKLVEPIAPKDIIRAESTRILHISDLHLSAQHAFPIGKGDIHQPTLATALYEALKERLPGIVIVSGDLTWSGSTEEFNQAYDCLDAIRSQLGLQKQHFIIVPGNHDIQWTQKQDIDASYDFDGKVSIASEKARANYIHFFNRWYGVSPNEFLSIGRRYFLVGGPTLDVLGLNSCALQQMEGHFAGIGRVTEKAFDDSAAMMGWHESVRATTIRMLVMHHHLLPVIVNERAKDAKSGFGIALDSGNQVMRALRQQVNLVLHGHQHHPFAGCINREEIIGTAIGNSNGLLVLGGGSAGVKDEHLGPIKQRTFNLLSLEHEQVRVELFITQNARDQFIPASEQIVARYGQTWQRKSH